MDGDATRKVATKLQREAWTDYEQARQLAVLENPDHAAIAKLQQDTIDRNATAIDAAVQAERERLLAGFDEVLDGFDDAAQSLSRVRQRVVLAIHDTPAPPAADDTTEAGNG